MAIRSEEDPISRGLIYEKEYFDKQDKNQTNMDFDRFIFMKPGTKNGFYDWRYDVSKIEEYSTFVIDHEKFINRPDAISYTVYGNSKYWWIIAFANNINDPFSGFYNGRKLKIPDIKVVKKNIGV